MVKFFTEFSHSFATYSSPPHPLQIPGIPWGQTLNQNNVVCSFSFWWSSKWLMALLWCHTQTLHPFTARPVVLALTCGRITNTQLMQIFTMKKMYVIFFSFIVSYSLLTSRFPSILCYLSLGSWNLIHVFPPVFLLLPPPLACQSSQLCPLSDLAFQQTYSRLFILLDTEETWMDSSPAQDLLLSSDQAPEWHVSRTGPPYHSKLSHRKGK